MDEAKPEVSVKRRTFTDEFKQDAVRLVTDEKYTFKVAANWAIVRSPRTAANATLALNPAA